MCKKPTRGNVLQNMTLHTIKVFIMITSFSEEMEPDCSEREWGTKVQAQHARQQKGKRQYFTTIYGWAVFRQRS